MKAILMSIRPKWVAKILNKEKTIEIRKRFPKDYVGWVYIYCTLGQGLVFDSEGKGLVNSKLFPYAKNCPEHNRLINGKVVARFWCDKVEEIKLPYTKFGTNEWVNGEFERTLQTETMDEETLLNKSCLSEEEMYKYLNFKHSPNYCGTAIHITKLEIFDKPKEISEFKSANKYEAFINQVKVYRVYKPLNRAPESYCFIEI